MDTLIPDIAIIEKIVRWLVVYVFLLVAFRVAGKRDGRPFARRAPSP